MAIKQSITELIGNTPLLELVNFEKANNLNAKIVAKLEYFNPAGSVKDRVANAMIADAEAKGVKFLIPVDNKVGKEYKPDTEAMVVNSDEIPDGWMGLDIGPKTQEIFADAVKDAGTVIWNGPMGVSEWDNFASGTIAVATAIADSNAISIIGGGDSAAAIQKLGFADKMSHISTGGGASLEYLEGKELPGIAALNDKK